MYLPFVAAKGRPKMGLKPLPLSTWIEIDEAFVAELSLKAALLTHHYEDVFAALPNTRSAQQEILQLLIEHLLEQFPAVYRPLKAGIQNRKTRQTWQFSDFAEAPLDLAARLVQEDLCLMLPGQGYHLAAASVCFPLRWSLRAKLGQPMRQIHQQVPDYPQRLADPVDGMFDRLRADFPGLRFNWTIVDSPELYLAQSKRNIQFNPEITARNAGEMLWLRVERQTLRRLPLSQGILFTIRTYVYPLVQVVQNPENAADLLGAIAAFTPDMQIYKNLLPFNQALTGYLYSCMSRRASPNATVAV
ncbi:MAG: DUF3445 domain-containing protein [Phormidesmis sp.]